MPAQDGAPAGGRGRVELVVAPHFPLFLWGVWRGVPVRGVCGGVVVWGGWAL